MATSFNLGLGEWEYGGEDEGNGGFWSKSWEISCKVSYTNSSMESTKMYWGVSIHILWVIPHLGKRDSTCISPIFWVNA